MKRFLFASLLPLVPFTAHAAALKIADVAAPAINCVFSTSCSVKVKDSRDDLPLSTGGKAVLQSRTFQGADGSVAAGLFVYEYRLDLRDAVGKKSISCIDWISLSFGPVVSTLNYGGDALSDHVFVITSGGTGNVGLASAVQTRGTIRFRFKSPVCSGGSTVKGDSSYFWGLVSTQPPKNVTAVIHETRGATRVMKARSPM